MIALPAFLRPRRQPHNIDLTGLNWVQPCPPELEDTDTMPRPIDRGALLEGLGACLVFWAALGAWIAFLLKVW